jgi:hypothetical protein
MDLRTFTSPAIGHTSLVGTGLITGAWLSYTTSSELVGGPASERPNGRAGKATAF